MTNEQGLKWKIGVVEISQIVELECGHIIQEVIRNAKPENIKKIEWLYPNFADESGKLKALVQGFVIKSNDKIILIDTCNGNDKKRTDISEWSGLNTDYLTKLMNIGVDPKEVDIVACTHLHMDHVGWNTKKEDGRWVPTFPNAKYLITKEEYEYWKQKPEKEISDDKAAFDDSISPIVEAGLAEFVEINHKIDDNISFVPTPGHTPSHVCVKIQSEGESAIISGDMLHHPCQLAEPTWDTEADTYPDQAIESRIKILNEIAGTGTLLIGSHFSNPVAGKVEKNEENFILKT